MMRFDILVAEGHQDAAEDYCMQVFADFLESHEISDIDAAQFFFDNAVSQILSFENLDRDKRESFWNLRENLNRQLSHLEILTRHRAFFNRLVVNYGASKEGILYQQDNQDMFLRMSYPWLSGDQVVIGVIDREHYRARILAKIIEAAKEWKDIRYTVTDQRDPETLVRKWALPGTEGLEHRVGGLEKNEAGAVSSDPLVHEKMVAARAEKIARVANVLPELEVLGEKKADILLVGWGGTYGHLYTATKKLLAEGKKVGFAHFDYINPLPKNTEEVLKNYKTILVCELNSGHFANYLRAKYPHMDIKQLNKVQGQPFVVHEITEAVEAM